MRKLIFGLFAIFLVIFMVSCISAQIVFTSQPNSKYNLGDVANVSVSLMSSTDLSDFFFVNLVCNGVTTTIYQEYLSMAAGSQKQADVSIPLTRSFLNGTSSTCNIKSIFGKDYALTNSFDVSNYINVNVSSTGTNFKPGQQILIQGNAVKYNNKGADGIANVTVSFDNNVVYHTTTPVKKGYFYFNFSLPKDSAAGSYFVRVNAYEVDSSGTETNNGSTGFGINLVQVPTNLELIFSNQSEIAGRTLEVKAILHDQTGNDIKSPVNFTVVDGKGSIIDQESVGSGDLLQVPISYDSLPSKWTVYANSDGLSTQSYFNVLPNEKISVDAFNGTIVVTNKGNVPYDKPLGVIIGDNRSLVFNLSLGVRKSKKFILSAPDGNYSVEVSSGGSKFFSGNMFLTGNAVNIQQASKGIVSLVKYPWVWAFVVLILAAALFFLLRKVRKKRFFGKANLNQFGSGLKRSSKSDEGKSSSEVSDVGGKNKANLSLSMHGEKQGASVVCLNLKNLDEFKSKMEGVNDTLTSLKSAAESCKSMLYENGNYLFFIFAPIKTKTFRSEKNSVKLAEQIKDMLDNHNRLFKQKIIFGLSAHYGTIVANHSGAGLKFMSLGDFSSTAKKLASMSTGNILLSGEIKERLMSDVRAEKRSEGGMEFYVLNEIKDKSKNQKFINDFMNKMDKEKKEE